MTTDSDAHIAQICSERDRLLCALQLVADRRLALTNERLARLPVDEAAAMVDRLDDGRRRHPDHGR